MDRTRRPSRLCFTSHPAVMASVRLSIGLLCFFVLCSRTVTCDDPCRSLRMIGCKCSSVPFGLVSVSCYTTPKNFSSLVSRLPAKTISLKAFITNTSPDTLKVFELGAANFSHLISLQTLHLVTIDPYSQSYIYINITESQKEVLWPLRNLQELKMNIRWAYNRRVIIQDVLSKSKKLKVLDLSDNLRAGSAIDLMLGLKNSKSLRILRLRNIRPGLPMTMWNKHLRLEGLQSSTLAEIDISQNGYVQIDGGLIEFAPRMTKFNASNNVLTVIDKHTYVLFDILLHPAVLEADLSAQEFPQVLNNANIVRSDETGLSRMEDDVRATERENKQAHISSLTHTNYTECIGTVFNDFDFCNMFLPQCASVLRKITYSKDFWCDLLLESNLLGERDCEYLPPASSLLSPNCAGCLIIPLVGTLRRLHIQNNQGIDLLRWFTEDKCFHPDNHLEFINLSNNGLRNLTLNIRTLSKLSTIDLSGNMITSLPGSAINQLSAHAGQLKNTTLKIDLSENPLQCSCNNRDFTNWVVDAPENIVFLNFNRYRCIEEDLREVWFHRLSKLRALDCLSNNVYIGLGVGAGIIISFILTALLSGIYRKRWWIRYNYFLARQLWSRRRREEEQSREYTYDVFVCYNDRDDDWVSEVLRPKLEDDHGITLCLHYRDFEMGNYISDMVIESIENSRKTLLILSPHFVQSQWCMFEMRMAHQKFFTSGQDVLLLAMFKPLGHIEISKTLKALLEQKNYVEWSDDAYGQKLFWARLIAAFDLPSTHSANRGATDGPSTQTTDDIDAPLIEA